jgi:hypothetical protein
VRPGLMCLGDEGGSRAEAAHRRRDYGRGAQSIAILRRVDGRDSSRSWACLRLPRVTSLDRGPGMRRSLRGAQKARACLA